MYCRLISICYSIRSLKVQKTWKTIVRNIKRKFTLNSNNPTPTAFSFPMFFFPRLCSYVFFMMVKLLAQNNKCSQIGSSVPTIITPLWLHENCWLVHGWHAVRSRWALGSPASELFKVKIMLCGVSCRKFNQIRPSGLQLAVFCFN